jgi:HK97 family phage major capsid protein/HK97 family phage prohead protease
VDHIKSWSVLTIKSINDEQRIIRGIASTPSTDRAGDIVEPKGAKFSLPIPLLSQHDHSSPIGMVTSAKITDKGIEIEATIPKNSGLGYVDKAWSQIKAGLVRGLSIGFKGTKAEQIKGGGLRFKEWTWLELSAVTIPCNAEANIVSVKQFDLSGSQQADEPEQSIAQTKSGDGQTPMLDRAKQTQSNKGKIMSLNEKIKSLESEILSAKDIMTGLIKAAESENRDLSEIEAAEIESAKNAIDSKEKSLSAYKAAEQTLARQIAAPAVVKADYMGSPKQRKGEEMIFAKMATAAVIAHAEKSNIVAAGQKHFANDNELNTVIKAAVDPATTTATGWAAELTRTAYGEFMDALRPNSFYAQLAGLGTSIAFGQNQSITFPTFAGGLDDLAGSFVGEAQLIPVKRTTYASKTLNRYRMAVISNFSEQILQSSIPNIQALVTNQILLDTAYTIDKTLIDAIAGSAVRPAGLLNGVTPGTSSGDTAADILADLRALVKPILAANGGQKLVLLMNPDQVMGLSFVTTATGAFVFPNVASSGLMGYQVIQSNNIPAGTVIAIDAAAFASAFDVPEFKVSDTATIVQASDAGAAPKIAGEKNIIPGVTDASVTSLYQQALVAVRMQMPLSWAMRRDGMVQALTGVAW